MINDSALNECLNQIRVIITRRELCWSHFLLQYSVFLRPWMKCSNTYQSPNAIELLRQRLLLIATNVAPIEQLGSHGHLIKRQRAIIIAKRIATNYWAFNSQTCPFLLKFLLENSNFKWVSTFFFGPKYWRKRQEWKFISFFKYLNYTFSATVHIYLFYWSPPTNYISIYIYQN